MSNNNIQLKDLLLKQLVEEEVVGIKFISHLFNTNVLMIRSVVAEFESRGFAKVIKIEDKLGIHSLILLDHAINFYTTGGFQNEFESKSYYRNDEKINSSMKEIEKIKEFRFLALKSSYEITGGNLDIWFKDYQIFADFPIKITNPEIQKVISYLKSKNYISLQNKDGQFQLTASGLDFIEEKILGDNYLSKSELKNFDEKLDEILNKLNKLGFGQEIIFDEIEELRVKSRKFSKSDFKKLAIGSIINLTIDNNVSNETANQILKMIFDIENLKLLE